MTTSARWACHIFQESTIKMNRYASSFAAFVSLWEDPNFFMRLKNSMIWVQKDLEGNKICVTEKNFCFIHFFSFLLAEKLFILHCCNKTDIKASSRCMIFITVLLQICENERAKENSSVISSKIGSLFGRDWFLRVWELIIT